MSGGAAGGGAAAAAAAAAARRRREEEEMTGYGAEDLEGYEFKILRSSLGRFGKPESLRAALAGEAEAGWELVEKFDNGRVRLKRKIAWREKDAHLARDPYRTWIGLSENRLGFLIVAIVLGVVVLAGIIAAIAG